MRRPRGEEVPKPFGFVPIDGHVKREKPPGHHLVCDGKTDETAPMTLIFEAKTLQPLQVGSGTHAVAEVEGRDQWLLDHVVMARVEHEAEKTYLVVPGSSLKGAVRSIAEAITDSCVSAATPAGNGVWRNAKRCSDIERLCPACSLFGAPSYLGRASFRDSIVPDGRSTVVSTPNLWAPARGRRLPRFYFSTGANEAQDRAGAGRLGRKFYFHRRPARGPVNRRIIKPTTLLNITVNLRPAGLSEAGLIICALGCHPEHRFPIKLGAGKPVGLGSIEFVPRKVIIYGNSQGSLPTGRLGGQCRELGGKELEEWIESSVDAAMRPKEEGKPLVDIARLQRLASIYSVEGFDTEAPSGAY